jgi:hypothetical protein
VHFNSPGYRRLASVLFADLMQSFEAYKKARLKPPAKLLMTAQNKIVEITPPLNVTASKVSPSQPC